MPTLHRIFGCLRLLFSWLFNNLRGIQKKRGVRLLSFHVLRPSHCLSLSNNNAKPTPNIKYTLVLHS